MSEKLGSLSADLQMKYEWQCLNCNHVFKNQHGGLKCTVCGGSLKRVEDREIVKELTMGD